MGTISRDIKWEIGQIWSMGSGPNWHQIGQRTRYS